MAPPERGESIRVVYATRVNGREAQFLSRGIETALISIGEKISTPTGTGFLTFAVTPRAPLKNNG
jgi:hypothetical protein